MPAVGDVFFLDFDLYRTYRDLRRLFYTRRAMTVYTAPTTPAYQRSFRIFSWSAIALLLGIWVFSIYEPDGVSRSVNIALALLMGAVVLVAIVYAFILSPKEAMRKLKRDLQWELADDKLIQKDKNGGTVEIVLNEVTSLHESHSWLIVRGGDPPKTITMPSDLNGFEQIKRDLTARCAVTPLKSTFSPLSFLPHVLWIVCFLFLIISHIRALVFISGAVLLLIWPLWTARSIRRIWRGRPIPKRLLFSCLLSWLILAWVVFKCVRAVV